MNIWLSVILSSASLVLTLPALAQNPGETSPARTPVPDAGPTEYTVLARIAPCYDLMDGVVEACPDILSDFWPPLAENDLRAVHRALVELSTRFHLERGARFNARVILHANRVFEVRIAIVANARSEQGRIRYQRVSGFGQTTAVAVRDALEHAALRPEHRPPSI
jgi:hypothetical protein